MSNELDQTTILRQLAQSYKQLPFSSRWPRRKTPDAEMSGWIKLRWHYFIYKFRLDHGGQTGNGLKNKIESTYFQWEGKNHIRDNLSL